MDFRKNFSILIVDDEKSLLDNLYQFLKAKGFKKVYTAKNWRNPGLNWKTLKLTLSF